MSYVAAFWPSVPCLRRHNGTQAPQEAEDSRMKTPRRTMRRGQEEEEEEGGRGGEDHDEDEEGHDETGWKSGSHVTAL